MEWVNKDWQRVKLISQLHLIQEVRTASMNFVLLYNLVVLYRDKSKR